MLEFGIFENDKPITIQPAHKITSNYGNPNLKYLKQKGWLPIYYDIPEYNHETHIHSGYTFEVLEDRAIAHAIIVEKEIELPVDEEEEIRLVEGMIQ